MSQILEPRDAVGNLIIKDGFVAVHFKTVPLFRVVAVENGGIHTANGITPAIVRVVSDLVLKQMPGVPFRVNHQSGNTWSRRASCSGR